jgi:hypothetical protein
VKGSWPRTPLGLAVLLWAIRADGAMPSQGYRGLSVDSVDSVGVQMESTLGPHGGTNVFQAEVQSSLSDWTLTAALPVATHRSYEGRALALGNVHVGVQRRLETRHGPAAVGLTLHAPTGGDAYSWVQTAEQLWPGSGADITWDVQRSEGERTWRWGARAGYHAHARYEPFPDHFARLMVHGGLEQTLRGPWSLWGEISAAYWDLTPVLAATFVAWEPSKGVRAQGGLLHPLATWMGLTPSQATRGFRESTIVVELTFTQ